MLFPHPKDFTPVCTTELGEVAKIKPEFDRRGVKIIGLSVDGLDEHNGWIGDIQETQGVILNFPLIADSDRTVSNLYDMIHPRGECSDSAPLTLPEIEQWRPKGSHRFFERGRARLTEGFCETLFFQPLAIEESRAVTVATVAENGDDGVAGTKTPCHLDRGTDINSRRTTEIETFLA